MSDVSNTLLDKPQHIVSLATSCLIVHPQMNIWTATVQDGQISDEVTAAKNADPDSGKFVKHLLAKNPEHKRILNYRQTVYNWMKRRTYDWAGPQRILPVVQYPTFMEEYKHHEKTFNDLVDEFVKVYPSIVANIAFGQNQMFKKEDYPPVDEVRRKFSMSLITTEVPVGDFRCNIATELADDLAKHYERQARTLVDGVLERQKAQLIEVMRSLSHCCEDDTTVEDGVVKVRRRRLYDTTLQRALELCDLFKEFNVDQDPQLEEARFKLASVLEGMTIDKLRDSDLARDRVKSGVDDILSKFGM
jgi:hypothetical protein